MIIFKDWTLSGPVEVIARQYDNLSRVLLVTGDLPEGYTWDMLVQVGRAMDIIHLYPMEGGVGAVLTKDQLSQSGYYQMQLRGIQGDVVRHTNVIQAPIPPSLSGSGQWPTVPSEFSQMEARMREIVAHPPIPGDNGCWQLWNPDTGEYAESEFPLPEGAGGKDGITPTIGDNGNWYLGDTDTGKPSRGEMGPQGPKGDTGATGADGKSAYLYAQDSGYTGTEEEFAAKLAAEGLDKALFVVNITQNSDGTISADKTYDEIAQAYNEGKYSIVARVNDFIYPLLGINVSSVLFSATIPDIIRLFSFIITSNNEVRMVAFQLATKDDKLPNPRPLTFTGAVNETYDGSSAKTIEIPIGTDGITPTIGENGNWFLGDVDTNKPSRGEQGPKGDTGATGANGQSAYAAAQAGGYTDTEANFYADLAAMQGLASALAAI